MDAIDNKVTLSPQQAAELQKIINEIKNGHPPYTQQIQELKALLNSQPPLSAYEKDCINNAIGQLEAGDTGDVAIISLGGFVAIATLQSILPM